MVAVTLNSVSLSATWTKPTTCMYAQCEHTHTHVHTPEGDEGQIGKNRFTLEGRKNGKGKTLREETQRERERKREEREKRVYQEKGKIYCRVWRSREGGKENREIGSIVVERPPSPY